MRKTLQILEIRDFKSLWLGQAISQFGDAFYFLVFLFMVDKITQDPLIVGYVAAIQALPFLILSPLAGSCADRFDRRKLMLYSDVFSTLILLAFAATLALMHTVPVPLMLATAGLLSSVNVFFLPAKSASIPRLVPPERVLEANALSAATQNLMPLIGIGLSGTVLAAISKAFPERFFLIAVIVNALTFVWSAIWIAKLPRILPERTEMGVEHPPMWQETKEGLKFMGQSPLLRTSLVLSFMMNFCIAPFMLVYVAVNREWFGGGYPTLAAFEGSFVFTMLVTSLWIGGRHFRRPTLWSMVALITVGFFVMLMAFSKNFWVFLLWNLLCGFGVPFQIPVLSFIQKTTPDSHRGRVQSLLAMVSQLAAPVSNFLGGLALSRFGPEKMFLFMGGGLALSAGCALLVKGYVGVTDEPIALPDSAKSV